MQRLFKYLGCILLITACVSVSAQDKNLFSRKGKNIPYKIFKTQDSKISIDDILTKNITFESANTLKEKSKPKDIYWVQLDLEKELKTLNRDSIWYLHLRYYEYASIFHNSKDEIEEFKFGTFEKIPTQNSVIFAPGIPFSNKTLFDNRYIYLKLQKSIAHSSVNKWKFIYFNQNQMELLQNFYNNKDLKNLIPIYLFVGVCSVMFLFTLMFFIYDKRLEFLFYSLYVLFLVLYLTPDILNLHILFFGEFNLSSYTFFQVCQIAINLFYVLFVMYYLNTKVNYTRLHLVIKTIVYILIFIFILDIIVLFTKQFIWHIRLLNIERLIMSIFGLGGMIYLIFKARNKFAYFVVTGSFFYMFGALGFLFFGERILMIIGSTIEIFIFAVGLTYKIQQENKDRIHFQKESINQKNKALRAQINPHFIFNSLSSIQHLITSNDRVSSLKYLSKFSRLTRNILESSIETNVVLNDEIKMLNDYLELESLRFDDAFTYSININNTIDPYAVEVPFMILQPFVENAIIHGLLPKKEGTKELEINFKEGNQAVICEINDNGIGRKASSQKEHIHKKEKKSRGLEVTQQRLEVLNQNEKENNIEIIDKVDGNGKPLGTKVIIKIPI